MAGQGSIARRLDGQLSVPCRTGSRRVRFGQVFVARLPSASEK